VKTNETWTKNTTTSGRLISSVMIAVQEFAMDVKRTRLLRGWPECCGKCMFIVRPE
jgi:hypothetical protein